MPSIHVSQLQHLPAVQMIWEQSTTADEVTHAFQQINHLLNISAEPLFIIVDMRSNPNFPLSATINGALFGPYRNPMLQEWLILGTNPLARTIERILKGVTGRSNVRWFATRDEVDAYLSQLGFTAAQH